MYLAESGAKKYAREFGGVWHDMFPVPVRREVAKAWRDEFEVEYATGAYDDLKPKKYQKTSPLLDGRGHLEGLLRSPLPPREAVRLVDGTSCATSYDSDFSQGGNGYRYRWIPTRRDLGRRRDRRRRVALHRRARVPGVRAHEARHGLRPRPRARQEARGRRPEAW